MIKYALKCGEGHVFESWFQSAAAFDGLESAGHLSCPECGGADVSKTLMTPQVSAKETDAAHVPMLSEPKSDVEKALAELRQKVEAGSDYVGTRFAEEARAIHEGESPERSIYGEARPEDAKKLVEDGVQIVPLPFAPKRKMQ